MLTYLFTLIAPLFFGLTFLFTSKKKDVAFLNKDYSNVIKGLCCIVVIYVHVHDRYANTLQDAIGSFGYVAVTLFFFFSAYGMLYNTEKNKTYLNFFWRNRLLGLLVPCLTVNAVNFFLTALIKHSFCLESLLYINGYVKVLLQWCLWFYIVEYFGQHYKIRSVILDGLLILGVVLSSLFLYFYVDAEVSAQAGWCYERIGLVWGILAYRYYGRIVCWINRNQILKSFLLTILGFVLGIAYIKFKSIPFYGEYLLKLLLGLVLISLLFTTTFNRQYGNKVNNWLGNISYEVYLSHVIVMGFLSFLLPMDINSGLFIFLTVTFTLFLSTGAHEICKSIKRKFRA